MDHSVRENIYDELNIFGKKKPMEISSVLEDYLVLIGKTGDIIFPWAKLKPLFKHKLDRVIQKFYEDYPAKDLPYSPNMEKFNFDHMHTKLLNAVEEFTGAPFTIQRLCELVVSPDKHYKRVDKFMRALEKDLLVVSTIEPVCKRQRTDSETSSLVNGVTETTGSLNGSAQSPQSTHSNEEANVASTPESDELNGKRTSFTNEEEKFDGESEADGKEVVKDENEQRSAPVDMMETTVSSSSMAESNESHVLGSPEQEKPHIEINNEEDVKSTNEDTDKTGQFDSPSPPKVQEKIGALPLDRYSETQSEAEKNDSKCDNEEQMVVEPGQNLDPCADQIVSDSSIDHPIATCSDDEPCSLSATAEEKEAEMKLEESASSEAGSSVVDSSPESSVATVPDSPSHSLEAEVSDSVSEMSTPDSLGCERVVDTVNIRSTAVASEETVQPTSPLVSTTTMHCTNIALPSDLDDGSVQQPAPEPMEDE